METATMELDDIKTTWQSLNRQLEKHNTLNLQLLRDNRSEKMKRAFRWAVTGQSLQLFFGVLLTCVFAPFWIQHRDSLHLVVYGLTMHAYGLSMILFAARDLALIAAIDYSAPVLAIQKQLSALRRQRQIAAQWFAIAGCLMWVPLTLIVFYWLGADLWIHAPQVVFWLIASGLASIAVLGLIVWLARRPGFARLRRAIDESIAGKSLLQAQAALDEIARFEQN